MRAFIAGLLLVAALPAFASGSSAAGSAGNGAATANSWESHPIPGRYIVVFKDRVTDTATEAARVMRGRGGEIHFTYRTAIKGFSATIPDAAFQAVRMHPNIEYIEQDQTVSLRGTQDDATWGLDRIDQRDLPLDGKYHYDTAAPSVHAFIIDTGIRAGHVDFSGRVQPGFTAFGDLRGTRDCNGHGTHVAGTVGGTTWGVAKEVKLVPVRVLNCRGSGSWSSVIAGLDWVASQTSLRPAVATMSLGGNPSNAVDAAVANVVSAGISVAVAGGNDNADACAYSPAREPSAITVGATTRDDARASYSNFGSCLDIFAPGSDITSASHISKTGQTTMSGTSMAAPHVAGAVALRLATNPDASPKEVAEFVLANASEDRLRDIGSGSPNRLVYSLSHD